MKIKYFIILIFIFLFNNYQLVLSQNNYLNQFTDLKLGESIQIIDNNKDSNFNCYIFQDIMPCIVCRESIINLTEKIIKKYKVNIVLFLGGSDKIFKNTNSEYPKYWTIFDDNIGAYKNFYKIKQYPFYFITNKEGKLIAMDKAGGSLLNEDNLDSILSKEEIKLNDTILNIDNIYLKLVKSIKIETEDDWIYGKMRYVLYSQISNNFYIFIPQTYSIFKSDTTGLINNKWKIPINNTISYYSPNWVIIDTSIFLVNNSYRDYREYLFFNLIDKKLTNFNIKTDLYDSLKLNLHWINYYSPYLNTFFSSVAPYENGKLNKNFNNLILCNLNNKTIIRFGYINNKYLQYQLSDLYYSIFYYDWNSDVLLEVENLTDNINFYNVKDQKFIKSIKIGFNKFYRDFNHDYNKDIPIKEKIDNNNSIPNYDKIFKIGINTYAILYFYIISEEDNIDNWSWNYYIHFINTDLNYNMDLQIPKNEIPFYIDGNLIYTSVLKDGDIYVKYYKYKFDF